MHSELFSIGSVTVYAYGLMIALGIIVGVLVADRRARTRGLSSDQVYSIVIIIVVFGVIGSKLLYCLFHLPDVRADPHMLISADGFVIYGGIILGMLALLVYCRVTSARFGDYFDLIAPSLALGQIFGRVGCLLAGCCYGHETASAFHLIFPEDSLAPSGVPLWPTQPVSAVGNAVIAIVLFRFARKPRPRGAVGLLYFLLYGIGRFVIEFFRADTQNSVGDLRMAQVISACLAVVSALLLWLIYHRAGKKSQTAAETGDNV